MAAIGVANEIGIDMDTVREALKNFSGVQRRFEFKGEDSGIKIYDDYGHHPTEILATLKAGKEALGQNAEFHSRLVVLFQPHRYTRTRDLLNDFFGAFTNADKVVLMDIYPAGEKPINGINSETLSKGIKDRGKDIIYIGERGRILDYLIGELKPGDMLLTLGAGDVWKIGEEFLKTQNSKLKSQN